MKREHWQWIILGVISVIALALLTLWWCKGASRRPVVYVNMKAAITEPSQQLGKTFTKAQAASVMADYVKVLPKAIQAYSKQHQVMIVSGVVLAGRDQRDITQTIIQRTLHEVSQ